ncbi:hypothetical protein [Cryptosporangium phraense]|nr:hypothetical protein [Cryptosporangium phraense]
MSDVFRLDSRLGDWDTADPADRAPLDRAIDALADRLINEDAVTAKH